jgi:Zn-dependent protease
MSWIFSRPVVLVPLFLSLAVHEWAHAWSAWKLGDDTAAQLGRATLNPFAHLDPVGTILLPLAGIPFGWAKPVPVNPVRFRRGIRMGTGILITAAAGPISNLCLALGCSALLAAAVRWPAPPDGLREPLVYFLETMVLLNALLAVFNLIPLTPLDGSRIAEGLVPRKLRPAWNRFASLGPVLLVAILVLPFVAGFSILDGPIEWVRAWIDAIR